MSVVGCGASDEVWMKECNGLEDGNPFMKCLRSVDETLIHTV